VAKQPDNERLRISTSASICAEIPGPPDDAITQYNAALHPAAELCRGTLSTWAWPGRRLPTLNDAIAQFESGAGHAAGLCRCPQQSGRRLGEDSGPFG